MIRLRTLIAPYPAEDMTCWLLEGTGFELSVPLAKESARVAAGKCQSCRTGKSREAHFSSRAYGPK